jgi:hypothetical protein
VVSTKSWERHSHKKLLPTTLPSISAMTEWMPGCCSIMDINPVAMSGDGKSAGKPCWPEIVLKAS